MKFADIVQRFDVSLNALTRERQAREIRGQKIVDLVSGNLNRAGLEFPPALLKQALTAGLRQAAVYQPDPLGQLAARQAVSRFYAGSGLAVPADHILITPGTSVSYWYLFKILANPGEQILCPRPSYPLLDSIAELCGVRLSGYRLEEGARWAIDFASLEAGISAKTRAIVLISPHNPTGAVATADEVERLAKIAVRHKLPIIADEVFSAFLIGAKRLARPAQHRAGLVFMLNGISKLLALPGMKLGWIAASGPAAEVQTAMRALDMLSDTLLPVNEVMQFALPTLLKQKRFIKRMAAEIKKRAQLSVSLLQKAGLEVTLPEAGFYLTIPLRGGLDEEMVALELLRKEGLLVHPGYFYDLPGSHLVMSFVNTLEILKTAIPKLRRG